MRQFNKSQKITGTNAERFNQFLQQGAEILITSVKGDRRERKGRLKGADLVLEFSTACQIFTKHSWIISN